MKIKILIGLTLSVILILISGCVEMPTPTETPTEKETPTVCGNNVIEEGETSENCCMDVGCPKNYSCINNSCIELEKYEEKIVLENDTDVGLHPLDIFACTSITAKVLELHSASETVSLPVTAMVNTVNEYITLESPEMLLNEGDEIIIYFQREKVGNLSIGNIIDINIRCLDGRVSKRDPFTKDTCFWRVVDNIKNTKLCYKKDPGPIINDALIPPDYEEAKGNS